MKWCRWLVGASVVAVLAYAVRQVDWAIATRAMRHASIGLLALAIALNGASLGLRSARWWIFLRALGIGSPRLAFHGVIVSCGLNNLLIANAGEAGRTVFIARATRASTASVLATVAVERLFDPLCFGLLVLLGSIMIPLPPSLFGARWAGLAALLTTVMLLVVLLGMRGSGRRSGPMHGWRHHLWILRARTMHLATPRRVGAALLLSSGLWLLQLAEYAVVASALGASLPFAASVAAMIAINAGLVLRATPAGLGYFEFAYALAASHFGASTDVAVAIALVIQMIEIIPVSVAALVITVRRSKSRQRWSAPDGPPLMNSPRSETLRFCSVR